MTSSLSHMVDPSAEIRVFNVSADKKPAEILVKEMKAEQGWLEMDTHLPEHKRPVMEQHGARNEECVLHGASLRVVLHSPD